MANRRMFSQRIVGDERFLEMPVSAQSLYFHLGIYADDDGFVNPQKVLRMIGANPDDLKVLLTKMFVIPFESGVVVVRHWKENNYIQSDRYTPTIYQDEFGKLDCIQNVYDLDTQVRLGKSKVRLELGKVRDKDTSLEYLSNIPLEDLEEFKTKVSATDSQIKNKADDLLNYCRAKGKKYKDYKSFLLNALKKDFPIKSQEISKYDKYEKN